MLIVLLAVPCSWVEIKVIFGWNPLMKTVPAYLFDKTQRPLLGQII